MVWGIGKLEFEDHKMEKGIELTRDRVPRPSESHREFHNSLI